MASNRHLGRIVVLQSLYEYEFRVQADDKSATLDEILTRNLDRYKDEIEDTAFVSELAHGVVDKQDSLDDQIRPLAPEWPLEQIARIDRNVLRLGMYELLHRGKEVPPKVAINEAVELAKAFGSDNSSKFINGVLGTAFRTLVEEAPSADTKAK